MHSCLSYSGANKLSKQDYCIHFAEVSHLSIRERLDAANWCLDKFDHDAVYLLGTKTITGRYRDQTVYGFYFAREKDVTIFKLRWG